MQNYEKKPAIIKSGRARDNQVLTKYHKSSPTQRSAIGASVRRLLCGLHECPLKPCTVLLRIAPMQFSAFLALFIVGTKCSLALAANDKSCTIIAAFISRVTYRVLNRATLPSTISEGLHKKSSFTCAQ